jgi:hypothetical protein
MNNPWLGIGEVGAPPVHIPLSTLSTDHGKDLEIKIEVHNPINGGVSFRRF